MHNKRNGLKVRSNREDWQLVEIARDGKEDSDLMADWATLKETLGDDQWELVEAVEMGDPKDVKSVKGISRRKRALADGFREFRAG